MKNVLVVHPQFCVLGGAELASLRLVEWLASCYDVRVVILTLASRDIVTLQRETQVQLDPDQVTIAIARVPPWVLSAQSRLHLMRLAFLHRDAKRYAPRFDLCISTYNEVDFGIRGFQYVHHPNFASRAFLHEFNMIATRNILDSVPFLDFLYRKVVLLIAGTTANGIRKNHTAVSSHFMRTILHDLYDIRSEVLYPTFLSRSLSGKIIPWEDRGFSFLSVGRFAPDKDFLELIGLYAQLYRKFPNAEFMIIGRVSDETYFSKVKQQAQLAQVPVTFHTDISSERLAELLSTSKFYVGPKKFEHFGLSVLEAAQAGCLTFVHDSGGQREIITPEVLRYRTAAELVTNADLLVADRTLREATLQQLTAGIAKCNIDDFCGNLKRILGPMLEE